MVLLKRKLYFSEDPEGGPTFSRGLGSNYFQGGGGLNAYSYGNPYNL